MHVLSHTFICRACFFQILAQMLEACGKFAWNFRNDHKTPNNRHLLSTSVWKSYNNPFQSPSLNYSVFCSENKDEVLINQQTQIGINRKTFFFESFDMHSFSLLLTAYLPVKSKLQHPPRANPRAFEFLKNFCSNSPLTGPKTFSNAPIPGRITRLLVYFSVASIMLLKPAKAVHVNMVY